MNEKRVLAVPTTEDPTSPANARMRLSDEYLDKALDVVADTLKLTGPDDTTLRWKAAQWVMEMSMGKPKQEIDTTSSTERQMAQALGAALAIWNQEKALPAAIEDGVYTLGVTVEGEVRDITEPPSSPTPEEPSFLILEPEFVAQVATRAGRLWDALPE